jgi:hypothetical protein
MYSRQNKSPRNESHKRHRGVFACAVTEKIIMILVWQRDALLESIWNFGQKLLIATDFNWFWNPSVFLHTRR